MDRRVPDFNIGRCQRVAHESGAPGSITDISLSAQDNGELMTRHSGAQCPGIKRQTAQECVRLWWNAAHFRLSYQLDGPFRFQRARPQRLSTAQLHSLFCFSII